MKKSLYLVLPAVFAFNVTNVSALEIDEKLTLRFLKISSTKKTILINRGGEDGLVVGDHAKFFITAGVIARGVAEKVSPSRSVWSLYRIVDPNEIVQDKVLNLKIASPVKITDDPSKSLKEEVIPGGTDTIAVEPGTEGEATEDADVNTINDADREELKNLGGSDDVEVDDEMASVKEVAPPKKTKPIKTAGGKRASKNSNVSMTSSGNEDYVSKDTSKNWEVWGALALNSLTGTSKSTAANSVSSSSSASGGLDISGSVEKYFLKSTGFLKDMSFNIFIHKSTLEIGETTKSSVDLFEYGLGANYHFYNPPSAIGRAIGFGTFSIGKGSSTATETPEVGDAITAEGSSSFFSVGAGAKYNFQNGFGIRGVVEYYSSTHEYAFEDSTTTVEFTGPRVQFGVAYRF